MTQTAAILALARRQPLLRAADVRAQGCSPQLLLRLHQSGQLQRVARGLYRLPDVDITEHQTLLEVSQRSNPLLFLESMFPFPGLRRERRVDKGTSPTDLP